MIQTPSYKEISKSGVFARFVLIVVVMLGFGVLLAVVGGFSPFLAFLVGWVCGFVS